MNKNGSITRGRPAQPLPDPIIIMKAVVLFLQMFMPETLAKRVVCVVFIAIGIPNDRITELIGVSDSSIWRVKKGIRSGNIDDVFVINRGSGRPGKAKGFEHKIFDTIRLAIQSK